MVHHSEGQVQDELCQDPQEDLTDIHAIDHIVDITDIDIDHGIGIILIIIIDRGIGDRGMLHGGQDIIIDLGITLLLMLEVEYS